MAFLTKEECVRRHRMLWNRIADRILEKEEVSWNYKEEAFEHFGWPMHNGEMINYCWACYYSRMKDFETFDDANKDEQKSWSNCHNCLFDWRNHDDEPWDRNYSNYCDDGTTLYSRFHELRDRNGDWEEAAIIAREIANMAGKGRGVKRLYG